MFWSDIYKAVLKQQQCICKTCIMTMYILFNFGAMGQTAYFQRNEDPTQVIRAIFHVCVLSNYFSVFDRCKTFLEMRSSYQPWVTCLKLWGGVPTSE